MKTIFSWIGKAIFVVIIILVVLKLYADNVINAGNIELTASIVYRLMPCVIMIGGIYIMIRSLFRRKGD